MSKGHSSFSKATRILAKLLIFGVILGSYTNASVFAAVGNNVSYTMEFSENTVENMPANILDGSSPDTQAIIPSGTTNTPTRPGYKFAGWCDQSTTKSGNNDTCASGHSYQPGETYPLSSTTGSANKIKLYAIWQEIPYMQDLTSSTIASLLSNEHSTATVRDKRDDQEYTIAKLKDGKYWMVENLNLAGGTALSANDTDVTSAYISSFSTSYNLKKTGSTIVLPASSTSGFSTDNYSYVYNSGNKTSNCASPGCYSYYSWGAATLGSGRRIGTDNTDAEQSICPKGWRLPTSGADSNNGWKRGDFYALATAYGANLESNYYENSATFYNNAGPGTTPNFLFAGLYLDGSFDNGGPYGAYWSSTSSSRSSIARYLYFNSSYVYSANNYTRRGGFSVRCVYDS